MSNALFWAITQSGGNILPTFQYNLPVPSSFGFLTPEYGTDRLSTDVGNEEPLLAA